PVLKKLEHLNMPAYVLPVFYLKEVLSNVVEYWIRTCTAFIDNNSKCSISTSAICLDLILHYYGFVKKKMEILNHIPFKKSFIRIIDFGMSNSEYKIQGIPEISNIRSIGMEIFKILYQIRTFHGKSKKFCKKQKREKSIEKPYQTRTFHGKSNDIKLRSNYQTYTRMRLRI
ncbi:hypothetical protein RFI_37219, partial [Reticulomyxa filosa]